MDSIFQNIPLIERILAVGRKTTEDMNEWKFDDNGVEYELFSPAKFKEYILSREFIYEFVRMANKDYDIFDGLNVARTIGKCIYSETLEEFFSPYFPN